MNRCMKCGRALKRPSESGYGPRCQLAVLGSKPRRPAPIVGPRRSRRVDEAQQELPL